MAWREKSKEWRVASDRALDEGDVHFEFGVERTRTMFYTVAKTILAVCLFLLAWQVIGEIVQAVRAVSFPMPWDTFTRGISLMAGAELDGSTIYEHTLASLTRWGIGYGLAAVVGVGAGIVLGTSRILHDLSMTSIHILQLIPGLAWVPIALLLFGLGNTATIFMIFMTALPPIVIATAGAVRAVPPIYLRVAQTMGMSSWDTFRHVHLPASSLQIIDGLRIGLGNGWRVLIAAEMVVGVALGLGYTIIQSRWSLDFTGAFVSIAVICIIGLFIERFLFAAIENRVMGRLGLSREAS